MHDRDVQPGSDIDRDTDVGCGGGRTIRKHAAAASVGMIYGVDYAAGSVAASRAENRAEVEKGRVEIQQASVSQLPFPDAKFDLVSAIETIYYWPDPVKDLQEISRVLKPAGRVIVICETYVGGRWGTVKGPAMKLLGAKNFSIDEYKHLLTSAGYIDIQVNVEPSRGWICAIGQRPLGLSGGHAT